MSPKCVLAVKDGITAATRRLVFQAAVAVLCPWTALALTNVSVSYQLALHTRSARSWESVLEMRYFLNPASRPSTSGEHATFWAVLNTQEDLSEGRKGKLYVQTADRS